MSKLEKIINIYVDSASPTEDDTGLNSERDDTSPTHQSESNEHALAPLDSSIASSHERSSCLLRFSLFLSSLSVCRDFPNDMREGV